MLIFTAERIRPAVESAGAQGDESFRPGEIFVMKYMGLPTVVTVLARTADKVSLWFGDVSPELLNQRVLFRMGKRARFLGMWMPWARVNPQRVVALDLADNLGTDQAFWLAKEPGQGSAA